MDNDYNQFIRIFLLCCHCTNANIFNNLIKITTKINNLEVKLNIIQVIMPILYQQCLHFCFDLKDLAQQIKPIIEKLYTYLIKQTHYA